MKKLKEMKNPFFVFSRRAIQRNEKEIVSEIPEWSLFLDKILELGGYAWENSYQDVMRLVPKKGNAKKLTAYINSLQKSKL